MTKFRDKAARLDFSNLPGLSTPAGEGGGTVPPPPTEPLILQTGSKRWGSLAVAQDGAVSIKLKAGVVAANRQKALAKLLADFVNEGDSGRK